MDDKKMERLALKAAQEYYEIDDGAGIGTYRSIESTNEFFRGMGLAIARKIRSEMEKEAKTWKR